MIRGERFEVDLGLEDEGDRTARAPQLPGSFVTDVLERQPGPSNPPKAPTLKNKTGFPEHKKRTVESRFHQKRAAQPVQDASNPSVNASETGGEIDAKPKPWVEEEKQRIDEENRQRLADMSPSQLEEERQELLSSLSPAMIERLLKRSNIESGSNESNLPSEPTQTVPNIARPNKTTPKFVSFAEPAADPEQPDKTTNDDPQTTPPLLEPLPHAPIHFPLPSQPPPLDPSSPTFLADLHTKYFPSLPTDPDKLAWMQASPSPSASEIDNHPALTPQTIRFAFTGALLAPRTASQIPTTAGLHHHGASPETAGYTIAELAHLSRSTYAAQRCLAFQTLGRLLYRLGKGEFGDPGELGESFGELARGLWFEVERGRVIETLARESEGRGGGRHVSARAYATEAVHLWRKGGGRRWKAG